MTKLRKHVMANLSHFQVLILFVKCHKSNTFNQADAVTLLLVSLSMFVEAVSVTI